MNGLTRYEITGGDGPADAYEASDGEWVLFSDVERLLSAVPAQVPDVICVGRARRFPKAGGNAGISWYAEDTLGDAAGHRTGQPKDGELLFVLAAAQKTEEGQ